MTIIVSCVAYVSMSMGHTTPPDMNVLGDSVSGVYYEQIPQVEGYDCAVHPSVKEATLAAYQSKNLHNIQLFRIDTKTMAIEKIKTPTVRLEVAE